MHDVFHLELHQFVPHLIGPGGRIAGTVLFEFPESLVPHREISRLMFRSEQDIDPLPLAYHVRIRPVRTRSFLDHRQEQGGHLVMRHRFLSSLQQWLEIHVVYRREMMIFIELEPLLDLLPDPVIPFEIIFRTQRLESGRDSRERKDASYAAVEPSFIRNEVGEVLSPLFIEFLDIILEPGE